MIKVTKKEKIIDKLTEVFLFGAITATVIFVAQLISNYAQSEIMLPVYYINAQNSGPYMTYEERWIPDGLSTEEQIVELFKLMKSPSKDGHKQAVKNNVELQKISIVGNTVTIDLSANYRTQSPMSETVSDSCIIKTLTGLKGIERVQFTVNRWQRTDRVITPLTAYNVIDDYESFRNLRAVAELYFSEETTGVLVPEKRELFYTVPETLEERVVEALIDGPYGDGLISTLPNDLKVRSVETTNNICYVDLGYTLPKEGEMMQETSDRFVYSIVNSLCSVNGVKGVQILINGQVVHSLGKTIIFYPLHYRAK